MPPFYGLIGDLSTDIILTNTSTTTDNKIIDLSKTSKSYLPMPFVIGYSLAQSTCQNYILKIYAFQIRVFIYNSQQS
ncbi:hypothetical protein [Helicobacter sp. 23-1046]